tara:strand:+ start:2817 stop:3077 length:261 start_codon:yes stop_codon:yes gene_type:complete
MKANKFMLDSIKLAGTLQKEIDKTPDLFNNMLESMIPNLSNQDKIKMQSLVKESNKLMEDAKNGSVSDIQQKIDELRNKYGRTNNT